MPPVLHPIWLQYLHISCLPANGYNHIMCAIYLSEHTLQFTEAFVQAPTLVGFWCFTSFQHLWSYQDRYRLVTVHTHGNIIVLPTWETRLLAPWAETAVSCIIWQWANRSLSYPINDQCQARKWQASILYGFGFTWLGNKQLSSTCEARIWAIQPEV